MSCSINSHNPMLITLTKETRPEQTIFYGLTGCRYEKVKLPKRLDSVDEIRKKTAIRWCVKNYLTRIKDSCPF